MLLSGSIDGVYVQEKRMFGVKKWGLRKRDVV